MAVSETNRKSIDLPMEVSNAILQKTQETSIVMQLAQQIALPGRGVVVPVITGDPKPAWVGETEKKPVSHPTMDTKKMQAYKMAVIVPFSMEFLRDNAALYSQLAARIPLVLASEFDATVFGRTAAPGENFDQLKACTAVDIETDPYKGFVTSELDIAENDGLMNGIVLSPQGRAMLLEAVDGNKRPLFIDSIAASAIPTILGHPTYSSKNAYTAGTPAVLGYTGDWTKAVYGVVNAIDMAVSDTATITDGSTQINLWERNMIAIRAEMEIGFRADLTAFNRLTGKSA